MDNLKIKKGSYQNINTWINESNVHNKLYRVWHKDENGKDTGDICDHMYFTEMIVLPDDDILIGMQSYDERITDGKFPCLEYYKLSQIIFSYYEDDQDGLEDESEN